MSDDLISVRGLVNNEFDIPVKECDAVLGEIKTVPATGYDGTRIELNFKDLDNVVSDVPYDLPTLTLNFGMSNRHESKWGYFADSLASLLDPSEDIQDTVGRTFHLVFADGRDGRPKPKPIWNRDADRETYPDGKVPTAVWVVTALDGAGASDEDFDIEEYCRQNLIGKTRAQFNKWAYADPRVKVDKDFLRSITDKSFVNALLTAGDVVENEDGVFEAAE